MLVHGANVESTRFSAKTQFGLIAIAAAAFHIAFANAALGPVILVYLGCLIELTRARTTRLAFYSGLVLGLLVFAPKLKFFYTIFGIAAAPLWLILALWHGVFVYLGQRARSFLPNRMALALIPMFWTGLEYFRSELYPLKFSWLSPAYAFGPNAALPILGAFGITLLLLYLLAAISQLAMRARAAAYAALVIATFLLRSLPFPSATDKTIRLAGIQLEFPVELEIPAKLDRLKANHPEADIYVLSEYTLDGPMPNCLRTWCKRNGKHLIVGGKDPAPNGDFYNTAFVIDPNGDIVFKQVKAVPIQFFKDGRPAPEQKLWNSPWGKIGLCVCYDLSYTRVIDELIRQRAQIIINPTMDVADWGLGQHQLHGRVPPLRAAEYRVPIFRLASSGISEAVDSRGRVLASAPFPGYEAMISAELPLAPRAAPPFDRYVAPICSVIALLALPSAIFASRRNPIQQLPIAQQIGSDT
jgi:apolipoprotein N-acyltransferase